jgi:hypothetical protein
MMTREKALMTCTINNAYAAVEEDLEGSPTPGKYAHPANAAGRTGRAAAGGCRELGLLAACGHRGEGLAA